MPSIAIRRHIRLWPAISVGRQAIGIIAWTKSGMRLGPDEAVHAAHRGAEEQAKAGDAELGQHPPLRLDHVVIIVGGKAHPQAVARLGGAAMADIVGQDDIIAADVERLAGAVELVGELRCEELPARCRRCRAGPSPH